MRRILIVCLMGLMLCFTGCASSGLAAQTAAGAGTGAQVSSQTAENEQQNNGIWTSEKMPVHLTYRRMWEYCAQAETDDEKKIAGIVDAIKELQVGKETEMAVDDYTDRLVFSFADGSEMQLEFEADCWVAEDGKRYEVEGLGAVRALLDEVLEDRK
ncbi:MAG: hypothetical protein J5947_07070 [Clostridium sp.]|nr:hypothetical protein [Clostridium sp.]